MTLVGDGISAAEAVAASICWLARWRHGNELGQAFDGGDQLSDQVTYWHKANCRFCVMPMEVLLDRFGLSRVDRDAMMAFKQLSRPARAARVREAQEVPWYEQLP